MTVRAVLNGLERARLLDRVGDPLRSLVQRVLPGTVRDVLHGGWLGHPVHPVAVQVPVGAWSSAAVLDLVPGAGPAATVLVAVGTATAAPAALAGLNDWASLTPEQRRVGLVHASCNVVAVALYAGSLAARLAGNRARGRRLSYAGLAVAGAGAYLGGHLSYRQAAGVNQAAPLLARIPAGWHDLGDVTAFTEGRPSVVRIGDVPVLVHRTGDRLTAMLESCAHQTGPLGEGKLTDIDGESCVVCPWHGSTFRLRDGAVLHGPAASDQPLLRVRTRNGRAEAARP